MEQLRRKLSADNVLETQLTEMVSKNCTVMPDKLPLMRLISQHQAGPDKQHDTERRFGDDEAGPQPVVSGSVVLVRPPSRMVLARLGEDTRSGRFWSSWWIPVRVILQSRELSGGIATLW
jgi:hypothetical protein